VRRSVRRASVGATTGTRGNDERARRAPSLVLSRAPLPRPAAALAVRRARPSTRRDPRGGASRALGGAPAIVAR
jgi:hypothetical protein